MSTDGRPLQYERVRISDHEVGRAFDLPPGYFAANLLAVRESMAEGFRRRRRPRFSIDLHRLWRFLLGWGPRQRPVFQITHPLFVHGATLGFRVLEQSFDGAGNRIIGKAQAVSAAPPLLMYDEVAPMTEFDVEEFKRKWREHWATKDRG